MSDYMSSKFSVVKSEQSDWAIINMDTREVVLAGLNIQDIKKIMSDCLKWIEELEAAL